MGFHNQRRYTDSIYTGLNDGGITPGRSVSARLEVVLEEGGTTPGLLRLLNAIATIATSTLIPFYNQVNYYVTFRVFDQGLLVSTCTYELTNHEALSILGLPLAPFYWSTITLDELMIEAAAAYSANCAHIPED